MRSHEIAYWRDIELLAAPLVEEWYEWMAELRRSGVPLAMKSIGVPSLHRGLLIESRFAPNADVQIFTPLRCAQAQPAGTVGIDFAGTWSKPPGITNIDVYATGPGGGGGSGRKGATSTVRCGGGGGSSGNVTTLDLIATDLSDEVPVYVGAGGAGANRQTVNSTNGATAVAPSDTTFGTYVGANYSNATYFPLCMACGGNGGIGGSASSGSGANPTSAGYTFQGKVGASASTTGGPASNASASVNTAGGGASGGGITSANAASNGGNGGPCTLYNATGISTTSQGIVGSASNGRSVVNSMLAMWLGLSASLVVPAGISLPSWGFFAPGGGGGGGASSQTATPAGNGANGFWGGGGGGSGAALDTTTPNSGYGGNGGDGFLIVIGF